MHTVNFFVKALRIAAAVLTMAAQVILIIIG